MFGDYDNKVDDDDDDHKGKGGKGKKGKGAVVKKGKKQIVYPNHIFGLKNENNTCFMAVV